MYITHLLALSLVSSICVAQVAARGAPDNVPSPSQSKTMTLFTSPDFSSQYTGLAPKAKAGADRFRPPDHLSYDYAPQVAQGNSTCYSLQVYRLAQDNPNSDSTRLAGYSECQSAAQFQVREADHPLNVSPR